MPSALHPHRVTAAAIGRRKTYITSTGTSNGLRKLWISSTLADVPAMAARSRRRPAGWVAPAGRGFARRLPARRRARWSAARCQWSYPALLSGLLYSGRMALDSSGSPRPQARAPVGQFPDQRPGGVQDFGRIVRAGLAVRALKQQRHPRCEPDTVHEPSRGKGGTAIRMVAVHGTGLRPAGPFRGGRRLAGLLRLAHPEAGRGRRGGLRRRLDVRDAGDRCQRLVGRARQLDLDLGERSSLRLTALDGDELKQVPLPGTAAPGPGGSAENRPGRR